MALTLTILFLRRHEGAATPHATKGLAVFEFSKIPLTLPIFHASLIMGMRFRQDVTSESRFIIQRKLIKLPNSFFFINFLISLSPRYSYPPLLFWINFVGDESPSNLDVIRKLN